MHWVKWHLDLCIPAQQGIVSGEDLSWVQYSCTSPVQPCKNLTVFMLSQVECFPITGMANMASGQNTRKTDSCSVLWTTHAWELRVQLLAQLQGHRVNLGYLLSL